MSKLCENTESQKAVVTQNPRGAGPSKYLEPPLLRSRKLTLAKSSHFLGGINESKCDFFQREEQWQQTKISEMPLAIRLFGPKEPKLRKDTESQVVGTHAKPEGEAGRSKYLEPPLLRPKKLTFAK